MAIFTNFGPAITESIRYHLGRSKLTKVGTLKAERGEKNSEDLIRRPAICYYILLYINTDNAIQFPFSRVLKSKPTEGAI